MADAYEGYAPGEHFEENTDKALVDIDLTDSTELWLIQWPVKQLKPQDFQGKELSLKLYRDGKLGSFESSGKTYDLMSFAAQEPDATVFVPSSSSESKIVGKISRRVCLVNYPEPGEFDKPNFSNANLSSQSRSWRSTTHRSTVLKGSLQGTSSAHSFGERSLETPQPSRKKKQEDRSSRPSERSLASRQDSHVTDTTFGSALSHGEKSKKKKKKVKLEE
ncbi:mediator-associated protein 2 [Iris pallida]|uniref:Mediator-associated protein 2 n=1 Tax=Iris pallida TaxID=29817 RepID=A0AAX6HAB1_IRIPA|nr:mediator-associated protein 2 [Iris pallida]